DKCTMILNVFDRISTLRDQLDHYHNFALLDRILVVWNHQTLKPPFKVSPNLLEFNGQKRSIEEEADASVRFLIPVHILPQDVDSLNNRYLPFPQIRTDCVISMDDDYKVPEASLKRLHTLFQNGHRDRLLGFQFVARSYKDVTPGQWAYSFSQKDGYSIVLPSGAMFHRKYLQMYTDLPKRAHEIVDAKMNGEDILFNLMIANATGKPPVIVNAPMFLLDYGKNG
ncbi:exostosin, partial [Chytriomyces sp. MP71]